MSSHVPPLEESELRVLERMAAILTSLDQPERVLEGLMDLFLAAMGAERGLVLTFGSAGEARPLVQRNIEPQLANDMAASWSRRAVEEMTGKGAIVVSEDVLNDQRFRDSESVIAHNIQSLLCVPVRSEGELAGAIYVDHRVASRSFSERDISFARALAELAGVALERSRAVQALAAENSALRARAQRYEYGDVIGASDAMQNLFDRLTRALAAPPEFAILITGENGTGKTAIARLLHRESDRAAKPFISLGAGAIPESLIESELFGHRRGSFTGADQDRLGLIARADGGTLFLDDVDALPSAMQPKLLTFLQDREYRPIGGDLRRADVRVICATNARLEDEVAAGTFREDLYYRLNGIPLEVPPLRERKEDIPLLARHFLAVYSKAVEKEIRGFTRLALAQMVAHRWPGNVRELMSEVVHAVTMTKGPYLAPDDFKSPELRDVRARSTVESIELDLETALDRTTRRVVEEALARADGNVSRAAKDVGVSRGKLYDLMGRVGLKGKGPRGGRSRDQTAPP